MLFKKFKIKKGGKMKKIIVGMMVVDKRNYLYTFNHYERDLYPQGQAHRILPVRCKDAYAYMVCFDLEVWEEDWWPDGDDKILTYQELYNPVCKYEGGTPPYKVIGDPWTAFVWLYICEVYWS